MLNEGTCNLCPKLQLLQTPYDPMIKAHSHLELPTIPLNLPVFPPSPPPIYALKCQGSSSGAAWSSHPARAKHLVNLHSRVQNSCPQLTPKARTLQEWGMPGKLQPSCPHCPALCQLAFAVFFLPWGSSTWPFTRKRQLKAATQLQCLKMPVSPFSWVGLEDCSCLPGERRKVGGGMKSCPYFLTAV